MEEIICHPHKCFVRDKLVYTFKVLKTLTDIAEVFDPVTLGLVIYVKKIIMRQCKNIYIYTRLFTEIIFMVGESWKHPKCYPTIENFLRYI